MVQDVTLSYTVTGVEVGHRTIPVTPTNPLPVATLGAAYSTQIDYNGGTNATYIGYAVPGSSTSAAVWQIKFLTYDSNSNPTSITYANGSGAFSFIWANRVIYTYS